MIRIQNVSKNFGRVEAVRDVSLGASGSGKTTLLRMLAGFEGVTSGQIVIDGQPMQTTPPHLRPINMVFQNYAIFPHLNVRDNIAYGLRRLGTPKAEQARMVEAMLDLIALPGYGDRRANQLSGGQMQRVALARALILKPKVLLLDEPLGALDKQLREQMQLELRLLQQRLGITFVLVTHDQEEALTLSDRVAVMAQGRVIQVDTPAGLYDRPKTRAVAGFIGSMNFFAATVHRQGEAEVAVEGLGRLRLNGQDDGRPHGAAATVAIRPEKLALAPRPPAGRAVEGQVQARQYLGGRHMLHVGLPGRTAPVAVAMQDGGADLAPGQAVWLTWQDDAILMLDSDPPGQDSR
jgi:spermidine/putrescine transport system ATP-binding protein/putrescine transport system ATP-binding protein